MSDNSEHFQRIWDNLVNEATESVRKHEEYMLCLNKIIDEIEKLNATVNPPSPREPSRAETDPRTYLPCPCGRWNIRNEDCVCLQKGHEPRRPFREIKCPQCGKEVMLCTPTASL